jgi:short-subunit dehydrogenase
LPAIDATVAQVIIAAVNDTDSRVVVLFGGRSEIGTEVAARLAPGATVVLAARRADDLAPQVAAMRAAGAAAVHVQEFDADDTAAHATVVDAVIAAHGPIGTAVLAFGILGDQDRAERDAAHAVAIVHTDYVAQVSLLTVLAERMRDAGRGRLADEPLARRANIVVFSSVAGARVRRANYVYGSAKAGLDGFAAGLTDALHGTGVHLLTVRPGFVIGRMTEGMSPAPLSSTPAQVADATVRALARGRRTVWVPQSLGVLVLVLRALPRAVWRRLPR